MPFDVVYLDRFEESKTLSVKNLIGRAGRSTNKPVFDFGSVILRPNAMSRFRKVYRKKNTLSSKSRLDTTDDKIDEKYEEYKEAIKTGEFSDEYNLTNKDLEKLKSDSVTTVVPTLLDMMFTDAGFVLPNAVAKEVYEMCIRDRSSQWNREKSTPLLSTMPICYAIRCVKRWRRNLNSLLLILTKYQRCRSISRNLACLPMTVQQKRSWK